MPMPTDDTKYTRVEYERRFLVRAAADWRVTAHAGSNRIDDTYLHGTRMRLRVVTETTTRTRTLKLTKKADSPSPYFRTLSRILLSDAEHRLFEALPGDRLTKTRYHLTHLDRVFAVDVFDKPLDGLILCEVEAPSLDELMRAQPPAFVHCEVTEDGFFSGANLCRTDRHDLLAKLTSLGAC
jgi:CYTH domain-containing protein